MMPDAAPATPRKPGFIPEFIEPFSGSELDTSRWLPHYLPQWSNRERSAARYSVRDGALELRIDADQLPWSPEFDGGTRVSSLQTGCRSGPVGSRSGQHPFRPDLVVREAQATTRLYTPRYGYFETRLKAVPLPGYMVALWMIGFEERPEESAEICICEIKGEHVGAERSRIGYGIHPFNDPAIRDEFYEDDLPLDASEFHVYAAAWTAGRVDFFVDGARIRTIDQDPGYAMQLMLNIYEFPQARNPESRGRTYPKALVVDYVRGYRWEGAGR